PADRINPRIPATVASAISKALSKEPAGRFNTCMEFLDRISPPGAPVIAPGISPTVLYMPDPVPSPAQGWIRRAISSTSEVFQSLLDIFQPLIAGGETASKEAPPPPPAPHPVAPPGLPIASEQTVILRRPVDS